MLSKMVARKVNRADSSPSGFCTLSIASLIEKHRHRIFLIAFYFGEREMSFSNAVDRNRHHAQTSAGVDLRSVRLYASCYELLSFNASPTYMIVRSGLIG
jgi:hypothetical protein